MADRDEKSWIRKFEPWRLTNEPKPEPEKPSNKWTERKIYDWIVANRIPVDYEPQRDTKKEVLKKLKEGGYI